jgi:hypothetical protein
MVNLEIHQKVFIRSADFSCCLIRPGTLYGTIKQAGEIQLHLLKIYLKKTKVTRCEILTIQKSLKSV